MKKKNQSVAKKASAFPKFAEINKFLRIVSDANRLKILLVLKGNQMNVTQIHTKLRLPQNLTSHHISKLKSAGLLNEKSEKTFRHYSINMKKLREYDNLFRKMFGI
jgi:DNA-binding transcriptional ArsR family regulator